MTIQRNTVALSVILFIYTVLIVAPGYLGGTSTGDAGAPSLVNPLIGIGCLFIAALFIIVRMQDGQSRSQVARLQQQLAQIRDASSTSEVEHEELVQKKLFEISIINASLHREIAERMQAETESRELQKRMELILNSAGEGIFGLDTDGNVTFANTAAAVMTGWDLEELVGRPHHELVHHTYPDGGPHPVEECLISQAYIDGIVHFSSDDIFWTRDGTSFPVEYVSTPIVDDGIICGAVVVFRDRSVFA
ncbi:MAG: PAS domain-containing protein [Desulfofustis sp.]|jgi:PAS domain S-box-containing protein|nr:PAS domain-containing protein [Desulfofustis sp.]